MTRTHYQEHSLADVVRDADEILLVTPADPSFRVVEESIVLPPDSDAPGFSYRLQRYVVDGVVRGSEDLVGQQIEVEPADLRGIRQSYIDYYSIGLSKHRIQARMTAYPTDASPGSIVFLTRSESGLQFCMLGAVVGRGGLDDVRQLVAK